MQGNSWGSQRAEGLTEAQITEELQNSGTDEIPLSVRNASNTVTWWRQRQAVINLKVCARFVCTVVKPEAAPCHNALKASFGMITVTIGAMSVSRDIVPTRVLMYLAGLVQCRVQ